MISVYHLIWLLPVTFIDGAIVGIFLYATAKTAEEEDKAERKYWNERSGRDR